MGLMMCDGKFVSRNEVALVPTPEASESWKPVPHIDVIEAVSEVVQAHKWQIMDENFDLAREGQKMFGVMRINKNKLTESCCGRMILVMNPRKMTASGEPRIWQKSTQKAMHRKDSGSCFRQEFPKNNRLIPLMKVR